jgi:predicted amidophosphoribosyltransferase
MNISKCPHCGVKLGNFLYADACPHCHEELKHNTRALVAAKKKDPQRRVLWPERLFFSVVRLVEM